MRLFQMSIVVALFVTNIFAAEIDLKKSSIQWKGKKVTGEHTGKIFYKSGTVEMKDGNLSGGEFVVDMSSFTVEDLTGNWATKFLGHMKSGDFFEVAKYPTSKLKITKVEAGKVIGNLTIKDKTNPVSFNVKKSGNAYSGKLTFDRTKFNMIYGSGDFFKNLGDKMIYNDVELDFKFVVK